MIRKALLAAACASLPQPASAVIRETAPGRYVCEAESGHYARTDVSDFFGAGTAMAVRIRMISANRHERFATMAGILFQLDNGKEARIDVYSPPNSDMLWVIPRAPDSIQGPALATRRLSSTIEISATMARGAIFVRAGNERGQINVEGRTLAARIITCTSGRFEIELVRDPRPPRRY